MMEEKEFGATRKGQEYFTESSIEYVLPDYNGDVRKILYSEANLRPGAKFIGDDEAEFSGQVIYKVIYLDSENNLAGTEFFSEYDMEMKLPDVAVEGVSNDMRVSNYAIRLLSPRKFSAKSSLSGNFKLTEKVKLAPTMWDGAEEGEIQTKRKTVNLRNAKITQAEEREIAHSCIHLDGVSEDELKILYFNAEPTVEETVVSDGAVNIKGKIDIAMVIETDGNAAYMQRKTVPFEERIPYEEDKEPLYVFPTVTVVSEKYAVNTDETGCEIVANIIFEYYARMEFNESVEIITDAFVTSCPTEISYMDFLYTGFSDRISHPVKHNATVKRNELCEGVLREIVFVRAFPKIESVSIEDNVVCVKGEIKYTGVTSEVNDDGSISYSGLKYTSIFEENVNINCQKQDKKASEIKISVLDTSVNLDSEKVYFASEFRLDGLLLEDKNERVVSECIGREKERYEREKAVIRVYYPDAEEDVFSVSRKFHTSVARLCENNTLVTEVSLDNSSVGLPKKILIY